jgi:hypothetical protein
MLRHFAEIASFSALANVLIDPTREPRGVKKTIEHLNGTGSKGCVKARPWTCPGVHVHKSALLNVAWSVYHPKATK